MPRRNRAVKNSYARRQKPKGHHLDQQEKKMLTELWEAAGIIDYNGSDEYNSAYTTRQEEEEDLK